MTHDLKSIVRQIKKDFGFVDIAENIQDPKDFISTGNKATDLMLEGGVAFGYITEWSGLSQSGKTLMLQQTLANAQSKYGAIGVWADRENAFMLKRAEELNIDVTNVILAKPADIPTVPDLEAFLSSTLKTIREKYEDVYIFVAVDSASSFSLTQKGEDMGKRAKELHSLFRKITPLIDIKTSINITNQVTFIPGIMFGNPKTTTGGEALRYYSTYRIGLDHKKNITNDNGDVIGHWIEMVVDKTRMGPANRKVTIPFYYKEGISEFGGYVRMLVDRGLVSPKNKSEFNSFKQKLVVYKDKQYSEDSPEKLIKEHPELDLKEWC